jgi:hypothetical protein
MENNYNATRKELERELAGLKKTYRNNSLDRETARYIAGEIHALEALTA